MLAVEGFQKFAVIPFGMSRIFKSYMPQQIGANRCKNRSIQVRIDNATLIVKAVLIILKETPDALSRRFDVVAHGTIVPGTITANRIDTMIF
jgi:hypothetical protein